jgi:hypothetical protein
MDLFRNRHKYSFLSFNFCPPGPHGESITEINEVDIYIELISSKTQIQIP